MRSFFQSTKEYLKNLLYGILGAALILTVATLGIFALWSFGNFMDARYEMLVPTWVRGTIGVSILTIPALMLLAKFGEKVRDDWATNHFRKTLS